MRLDYEFKQKPSKHLRGIVGTSGFPDLWHLSSLMPQLKEKWYQNGAGYKN